MFLIDEKGMAIGEVDTASALRRAEEADMDLVLVSPQANPPVAKILDYGKFRYEQDRKDRKNRAKKSQDIKEIRLSYTTQGHDLEVKINQAKRFMEEGHKIKLRMKLVGREIVFREKAIELLNQVRDELNTTYEQPIQQQGKQFTVLLKEKKS